MQSSIQSSDSDYMRNSKIGNVSSSNLDHVSNLLKVNCSRFHNDQATPSQSSLNKQITAQSVSQRLQELLARRPSCIQMKPTLANFASHRNDEISQPNNSGIHENLKNKDVDSTQKFIGQKFQYVPQDNTMVSEMIKSNTNVT